MSSIFNDQLTDPSFSSNINSSCEYSSNNNNLAVGDLSSNNIAYTFDTQVIDNYIPTSNAIKITDNFESIDQLQYSAETFQHSNNTIPILKQTISTDSTGIKYKKFHQFSKESVIQETNNLHHNNKQSELIQNNSSLSVQSISLSSSQQESKLISDEDSELNNTDDFKMTKDLTNQMYETFPNSELLEGAYERLDLSNNQLSRMNKPIPIGVKELILNDNRFAFLTNLKGSQLTLLELRNNRLISVQGIKVCHRLIQLDISNNFLSDDQLDEIKQLKELQTLLIKHNHLKNETIIDRFSGNKKLKLLDLSQNDIEDIVIRENCYVRKLCLQQNKIESFKVLLNEDTNDFHHPSKPKIYINKIDISSNGLQYFDAKHLISLRELIVQDNSLLDLDLSNNYKLKKVNANRNQLSSIKFKEGETYAFMKKLLIGSNRLVKITFIAQHLQFLEELDVSDNNIEDHKHFFDNISKLQHLMKLNMERNPFDEEAKQIQTTLQSKSYTYSQSQSTQQRQQEQEHTLQEEEEEQMQLKQHLIDNAEKDEYKSKGRDNNILNSHFTSVSNGNHLIMYQSCDNNNNSNLLNCQLSPDLFNSIDQQYLTLKSEQHQSVDQSNQQNTHKHTLNQQSQNKQQVHTQLYSKQSVHQESHCKNQDDKQDNLNNRSLEYDNSSDLWNNLGKNTKKSIHPINEEEDENNYIEESQRNKNINSNKIFQSNLFQKKHNQSGDGSNYESEAKILNDQLNFSISEEDELSSKHMNSKQSDNAQSDSITLRSRQFKQQSQKEGSLNNTTDSNTDQSLQGYRQKERITSKLENQKNINEEDNFNNSSKENSKKYSNRTFNDLDEEERQLKLAIETMESSITEGSLLSEITNEMTKEYRNNLNSLKEYYKDRKGQKKLRKEDGETLLQMNQILMQKIILKLGDDPSLKQNPYFLRCKQLLQQNFQTFEPQNKKQSVQSVLKENDLNIKNSQFQKIKISKQDDSGLQSNSFKMESLDSICSPQFQKEQFFNETNEPKYNIFQQKQQIANKEKTSNCIINKRVDHYFRKNTQQDDQFDISSKDMKQQHDHKQFQNERRESSQSPQQKKNTVNQNYDYPLNNKPNENEYDLIFAKQKPQNTQYTFPRQMTSLLSTQEQNSTYSNNNHSKLRQSKNTSQSESISYHFRNNSSNSINNNNQNNNNNNYNNNNNKTLNFLDTTNNNEQSYMNPTSYPLFSDVSQIPVITSSSPLQNNDNKRQYSQSSRLPTYEIDSIVNHPQSQSHHQTCRGILKQKQQQNFKKGSLQIQQAPTSPFNKQCNINCVTEEDFLKVFKEYIISDNEVLDGNKQNGNKENRQDLIVRKKFIKLIVREFLSNCDLYYNTQTIDEILQNMMPYIDDQENVRFDKLYSLLIKNLQSQVEFQNYSQMHLDQSHAQRQDSQLSSSNNNYLDRSSDPIQDSHLHSADHFNFEERIKTPPQIITFRSKLRESTIEKKNQVRQSNQSLQSQNQNAGQTNKQLQSIQSLSQSQQKEDDCLNIFSHQRKSSPSPQQNNLHKQYKAQRDNSLSLPNTQQIMNLVADNSFFSTADQKNNHTHNFTYNENQNTSFDRFLLQQQHKFNQQPSSIQRSNPSTPKPQKQVSQRDYSHMRLSVGYEDFYSKITPYIKYILQQSSMKQVQKQVQSHNQNYNYNYRDTSVNTQATIKQIDRSCDEYRAVGYLLAELKLDLHRVVKSIHSQSLHILHAKQQRMYKQQLQSLSLSESIQSNRVANYISDSSLIFHDYLVLLHATNLTDLGKIIETSFLQFYGDHPSLFSLKKNIAVSEQEKYQKRKRFNISSQNQMSTNTSTIDGLNRQKWRIIISKVYLGKCLIDSLNTVDQFDLEQSLDFIIDEGYQSIFFEKSDAYMIFDNQLAVPLYLCEYYHSS